MPGKTIEIKLAKPIAGHGGAITKVVLREPTYDEYCQHGDPFIVALSPGSKIPFMVEDQAAMSAYADLLLVEPDPLIVRQGGFELAREIRRAVRSFFHDGSEAAEGSETSQTSSPSAPIKTAMPSDVSPSANSSTGMAAPSPGNAAARTSRPIPEPQARARRPRRGR
jgi:hypothetical protein